MLYSGCCLGVNYENKSRPKSLTWGKTLNFFKAIHEYNKIEFLTMK